MPDEAENQAEVSPSQQNRRYGLTVTYRLTPEEKARLVKEARDLGLTFQQLHELRMFGTYRPVGKMGGDKPRGKKRSQMEELPIAV